MERNYYLDNYKAILIIFVVTTHFFGGMAGETGLIKTYTVFTNLFYMPAFIAISGYFSKKNYVLKLVKSILMPYLFFQILNLIVDYFVLHQDLRFSLFMPEFTLWYLLSLFFWRLIIEGFMKLKYPLLFAVILSLIIGMDINIGGLLSLSRTIYFFPFFVLGYQCNVDKILKCRTKAVQILALGIMMATVIVIFFTCKGYSEFYFRGSTSYEGLGQSTISGILFRIFCYVIAILLTFCIAMWIPKKKNMFSILGSRTMSIYMWHGLIYRIVRYGTPIYSVLMMWGMGGRLILLFGVLILVVILGSKPICQVTALISKIPVEKLIRSN